jgi:hypothetical protein
VVLFLLAKQNKKGFFVLFLLDGKAIQIKREGLSNIITLLVDPAREPTVILPTIHLRRACREVTVVGLGDGLCDMSGEDTSIEESAKGVFVKLGKKLGQVGGRSNVSRRHDGCDFERRGK